jgi:predicted DNA-binding protein YlxM (UPF0122 family)
MLFDFYGELLTEKQKQAYELHFNEDLSLAEIADIMDISRQAVHDNLKKCDRQLQKYEEKLSLVRKFVENKHLIEAISEKSMIESKDADELYSCIMEIRKLSGKMLSNL